MKDLQGMIMPMLPTSYLVPTPVFKMHNLASVIGEDELSPIDKTYIKFGLEFESKFLNQPPSDNRSIIETLELGLTLLRLLPRQELDRIDTKI